uniref:Uncharacterized protein n=1 Tax=Fagus sylvatica TaxID=28930 RepID=A0A2N9EXW6_FAGSY
MRAAHDGPARVVVLPRGSLILPRQPPSNPPRFSRARTLFDPIFEGSFGGLSGTQNGSCRHIVGKLSTSSFQRYKVLQIGVRTRELWLPEVGVSELFLCTFSGEDSGQTGDAIGEPRVPRRSRSRHLSNAPGLADQLVASRKDSAREGGSCAAYFLQGSGFAGIRAWTCEIWSPRTEATGVFLVRLRAVFRSGFRLDPVKFLAIREFHVVHGCVFFPTCPGSRINLLRVRKTLCASVATSVGKFRKFSAQPYISSACFHARGRRSSRCRISTILVSSESLRYLLFNGTGLAQRRAWADLVRAASFCVPTPEKIPGVLRKIFLSLRVTSLSDALALNPVDTRVKSLRSRAPESPFALLSPNTSGNLALGLPNRKSGDQRSGNPQSKHVGDVSSEGSSGRDRSPVLTPWILVNLPLLGFVADGGIPCGPFLRDFWLLCALDAMRASIEVVVALSAGSECTCIPYFRLSYLVVLTTCSWSLAHLVGLSDALDHLVGRHFLNLRSVRLKPSILSTTFLMVNSLFPGFDTITDLGDSARGVHSPG